MREREVNLALALQKRWLEFALILLLLPFSAMAERARNPASATAFIRVIGKIRIEYQDVWDKSIEEKDIELGTGSGFVISSYGHVLTNYHVISDEEILKNVEGVDIKLQMDVEKVLVVFPPTGTSSSAAVEYVASIDAVDSDLDLAVLSVTGVDLPYIPFGDSDAVVSGEPVRVLGFPFGRRVEVGRTSVPDIVPKVSVSSGAISARRGSENGTHLLQTSANVNPGNSGGPMVDLEGFARGVIRLKLGKADGIGFAIPINEVKDFLESHGLDQLLPVSRLRLGTEQMLSEKGISIRLPESQEDLAPSRVHVDTGRESEEVALVIDRVVTPWSLEQMENALISSQTFERFTSSGGANETLRSEDGRALLGRSVGTITENGAPYTMEYAVLDLGEEKLVARFLGPDEVVAFNASILRGSLMSLSAEPMMTARVQRGLQVEWTKAPLPSPRAPHLVMPAGWILEQGARVDCPRLSSPDSAILASPLGDYTVAFVAAWWAEGIHPDEATASCSEQQGSLGPSSYSSRSEYLGVGYQIEGVYLEHDGGLLQLELATPLEKYDFVYETFRDWAAKNRQ